MRTIVVDRSPFNCVGLTELFTAASRFAVLYYIDLFNKMRAREFYMCMVSRSFVEAKFYYRGYASDLRLLALIRCLN